MDNLLLRRRALFSGLWQSHELEEWENFLGLGFWQVQIVHAVALVVSGLPTEQRRAGLTALMGPIIEQLQATLQPGRPLSANGTLNGSSVGTLQAQPSSGLDLTLVERLTTLFRSVPHYMV